MSILFFDVDGTIYDSGVPAYVRDAFAYLKSRGHILCLNTGRAKGIVPASVMELDFHGYVTGTGSMVDFGDTILFENYIPTDVIASAYDEFTKRRMAFCIETYDIMYETVHMSELRRPMLHRNDTRSQLEHLETDRLNIRDTADNFDFSKNVTKISYLVTPEEDICLHRVLDGSCFILEEKNSRSGYIYGEAVCRGSSKSHGAQIICDYLKTDKKYAVAFGDGMNDIDLIRWAGTGVAMGNASDKVKAEADIVCGDIANDGIAAAIRDLGL